LKFLRFFTNDNNTIDNNTIYDKNTDISFTENIKTGYFADEKIIELSDPIEAVLNNWKNRDYIENNIIASHSIEDISFISPVNPSKIICVGLNYKDHAEELSMELPNEPKIFLKPPSSVIGHLDNIIFPAMSSEVDYEAELAVVISKEGKNVSSDMANDYIGGYTIINDVTARDLQRKDGQWTRAKSFDTFAPIGPYIETEMNPMDQNISLSLNGKIKQQSNTKNMIFSPVDLVEFVSNIMTLNPGDIIATGTPAGVGEMKIGDSVEISVEDIGVLKNNIF
jgi:2-keto-4-pentenoate hydratase/2-oxohepta-3-ene-1,7-dioic acid hydratase in catechol pathway